MPLQRPDADGVLELAARIGIRLTAAEARIFAGRLADQIGGLEDFL